MTSQWRLTGAAALATVLTALSLAPTIETGGWLVTAVFLVAVVAASAGLARHLSAPRWLVTVVALTGWALTLTAQFARGVAVLGVIPGPGAWHRLTDLVRGGAETVWQVGPPVPAEPGLVLVVVGGVGLVAVVVDAIAVTWRRPAAAGLPLFVLYLVPASVLPDGVPWPLFVLAALGWLALLLSEGRARLRSWGRIVSAHDDSRTPSSVAVAATGRRLGAVALAAAVVVPVLLPMLSHGVMGARGDGGGDGPGDGTPSATRRVVTINPLVTLKRDLVRGADTLLLSYRTDDLSPDYLRLATLDTFDGTSWQLQSLSAPESQQARDGLPDAPGLSDQVARTPVTTQLQVLGLDGQRLPVPYPTVQVLIDGDWRFDSNSLDVFTPTRWGTTLGTSYTVSSLALTPTAFQLRQVDPAVPAELAHFTDVPPFTDTVLKPITTRITRDATTQYDRALAMQNWFRREFTYSLERRSGNGLSDLQAFLADRSGYCEQFAATMAIMARVVGIPSRVVVGFTPGSREADGTWEVTAHDAHAWPELWFNDVGWVRFEPTPGGGDGGGTPLWAPVPVEPGPAGSGSPSSGPPGQQQPGPADRHLPPEPTGAVPTDLSRAAPDQPGLPRWPFVLAALLVAAVVLAAPAVADAALRRRRWQEVHSAAAAAEAGWQDVLDAVRDLQLHPAPTETTRDLVRRLPHDAGMSAAGRKALAALARAVEQVRYADEQPGSLGPDELAALSATVCEDLQAALSSSDRWKARWWPASGRAYVAEVVGGVGAQGDRVLAALSRWSRSVSGRVRRDGGPTALRSDA